LHKACPKSLIKKRLSAILPKKCSLGLGQDPSGAHKLLKFM